MGVTYVTKAEVGVFPSSLGTVKVRIVNQDGPNAGDYLDFRVFVNGDTATNKGFKIPLSEVGDFADLIITVADAIEELQA